MENSTKLIMAIVAIGMLLGAVFTPFITVVAGISLWIILWIGQGGMSEGNPYKRMNMGGGVANWAVVSQYQKNEEIEVRDSGSFYTAVFFFGTGAILIAIGIVWMWLGGAFR